MFKQTINTKYIGPRNVKGSRVSARTSGGKRIILDWDDTLGSAKNHERAMCQLASNLNWDYSQAVAGTLKDGSIIWVFP